jgi:hypothetical protein
MTTVIKKPDSVALRSAIYRLEDYILNELEPAPVETEHRFTPGLYSREMRVPAGVIMTGYIHKTEHISIFLEGRMLVATENGGKEIVAPIVEIAKPGIKRAGIALEDVRWITVHATEETDIDKLEELLLTNDFSEVSIEGETSVMIEESEVE